MWGFYPPARPRKPTHNLYCPKCGWNVEIEYGEPWPQCAVCGEAKVGPSWWSAKGEIDPTALQPVEDEDIGP